MLPDWFTCDPAQLAKDSGLEPHQVTTEGTQAAMQVLVGRAFETHAKLVLGEAVSNAMPLAFPLKPAVMALAFPNETLEELAARVESQKTQAIEAAKLFVIAQLYYSLPGGTEVERAKGHWINASKLQGTLKRDLTTIRRRYCLATTTPFV